MTALHPAVGWVLVAVVTLLVVASVAVTVLRRARPSGDFTELRLRVRTWWILVAAFAGALVLSRTLSLLFLGFVSFLALKEYLSLIPSRRADRRVLFWAYLAIPFQYWWVHTGWFGMFIIWIPVYAFLFLSARVVLTGQTEGYLRAVGTLHWGLMTCVFSLSHAAFLLVLPSVAAGAPGGPGLLLFCVLLTQANDVAQYCWGKTLGRRRVVPAVSPGKTWGGLLGGVATTTALGALLAPWLTPLGAESLAGAYAGASTVLGWDTGLPLRAWWWRHAAGASAGLLVGVAGFFGDITISAVKRDLGIKDTGSILPGHGGVLDRVDSLTFTAPLLFHFVYFFCY